MFKADSSDFRVYSFIFRALAILVAAHIARASAIEFFGTEHAGAGLGGYVLTLAGLFTFAGHRWAAVVFAWAVAWAAQHAAGAAGAPLAQSVGAMLPLAFLVFAPPMFGIFGVRRLIV